MCACQILQPCLVLAPACVLMERHLYCTGLVLYTHLQLQVRSHQECMSTCPEMHPCPNTASSTAHGRCTYMYIQARPQHTPSTVSTLHISKTIIMRNLAEDCHQKAASEPKQSSRAAHCCCTFIFHYRTPRAPSAQ